MLGLPQGHNIIIIILLCDVTRPQLKRLNLHFNQTVNTNIISLRRRNTIYLQFNFILSYNPILSDFVNNGDFKGTNVNGNPKIERSEKKIRS